MLSPIDNLYREIYGELPAKAGTAYERFAAAALTIAQPGCDAIHDARIRGMFSDTLHQIDVLFAKGTVVGEAKDYSGRGDKVGLSELQKLAGALVDLPAEKGAFFSATNYTKPARKYAQATAQMFGKATELFELRPSVKYDLDGRIQKLTFSMHIHTPDYENSRFAPAYTEEGLARMQALEREGVLSDGQPFQLGEIVAADGSSLIKIEELTRRGFDWGKNKKVAASWVLRGGYIHVDDSLIPIHGITYDVPKHEEICEFSITTEGRAVLLIKSLDGETDKLIRDADLKKITFDENGKATYNG